MSHLDLTMTDYFTEDEIRTHAEANVSRVAASSSVYLDSEGNGVISIPYEQYQVQLSAAAQYIGWNRVYEILANDTCATFHLKYGREFLLYEWCVRDEIKDHIACYNYVTHKSKYPNVLYVGASYFIKMDDANIISATRIIDIRESEAFIGSQQGMMFSYLQGVRTCYRGTEMDKYAILR